MQEQKTEKQKVKSRKPVADDVKPADEAAIVEKENAAAVESDSRKDDGEAADATNKMEDAGKNDVDKKDYTNFRNY